MTRHIEQRASGYQVNHPHILDIEPGDMIRVEEPGRERWGNMAVRVDYQQNMVLVRDNIGGTLEREEWAHIDSVACSWNIGGIDVALQQIDALHAACMARYE